MTKETKDIQEAVNKKLSSLLGFVDERQIVTFDKTKGFIFIGGKSIDEDRILNLQSEANFILQSDLWKILDETIRFMAYEMMFVKSKTYEDVQSGKMWLYHLDIQKKIMSIFKSYQKRVEKK